VFGCGWFMSDTTLTPRQAWQPLTPRGVAAFAAAPLGRLLLAQAVVATLCMALVAWFVAAKWFPVVREANRWLPDGAGVQNGTLRWPTNSPVRLAENRFLALVVDAVGGGARGSVADLELTLHRDRFTASSLLGYVERAYPQRWRVSLGRAEVVPWWGAREGVMLSLLVLVGGVGLMASWWVMALLYCPVVKVVAFFANRKLGWRGSWKLGGAALLPGAGVVMLGLFCYGWLRMDLVHLALAYLLHIVTGWTYVAVSPFFLPKDSPAVLSAGNPFRADSPEPAPRKAPPANPFAGPEGDEGDGGKV
jgi:hypothetical protein